MATPRCPRCGFAFGWDGRKCSHCPPPSRARQLWESISRFEEQVNSTKDITSRQLLAIAGGCLRRVWDFLPETVRDVPDAFESGPAAVRNHAGFAEELALINRDREFQVAAEAIRTTLTRNSLPELVRAVAEAATTCRAAVSNRDYPPRELVSFSLPPDLERYRADVANNIWSDQRRRLRSNASTPIAAAYQHLHDAWMQYNRSRSQLAASEEGAQCEIVRDIQGYPEVTVVFDPDVRTSTAVAMARGFIESRDFSAMPILADALQDAGCEDPEILEHCRAEKPHFRGCWVIEMILAKG